jgi:uncharacterized protein YycO
MVADYPPIGSFGVTATKGIIPWAIRLLTFSRYNHAFIVGPRGIIVEAQPGGARFSHVSRYPKAKYNLHTVLPLSTREKIWDVAVGFTQANGGKGVPYNWVDDAALGLRFFGLWFPTINKRISRADRLQCAQLVDRAYTLAGITLFDDGRLPMAVDPGDLGDILAD